MSETARRVRSKENKGDTFTAYMCKTDFEHDARDASDGARVYPSEAAVRRERGCVSECGIVEVTVALNRVVQQGDWSALLPSTSMQGEK